MGVVMWANKLSTMACVALRTAAGRLLNTAMALRGKSAINRWVLASAEVELEGS